MKALLTKGEKKMSGLFVVSKIPRHIDFLYVPLEQLPTAIQYFTGSATFNVELRNRAISMGYKLSDIGLYKGDERIPLKDEKDLFKILKLKYVKPENRGKLKI